jgi:hypothetical protein
MVEGSKESHDDSAAPLKASYFAVAFEKPKPPHSKDT